MAQQPGILTYKDELLADKSVRRTYSDGRFEWRRRLPDGRVEWQDNQGNSGVDELLGDGILKRTFASGQSGYGREQGYGRTAWGTPGNLVVTMNETSFGGRVSAILTGIGAGMLLGSVVAPPQVLSAEEEQALREKARENTSGNGGDGDGGGDGGWGDSDGDTDDGFGGDSDFG
jgi:hypothetical protein